jgi:hypothetical protein
MEDESQKKYTHLPPLTDEFLFQIVFCMEDQVNNYFLDLKNQNICETVFIEERVKKNPDRFLPLPQWLPSDGFHTMEKFVSTLRNPIYREKLKEVLQSGRGVFRQFKDVLQEQPSIQRLWYYYKDREMRNRIYEWYEVHDSAFSIALLSDSGPQEDTLEVIKEDFIISEDYDSYVQDFEQFRDMCIYRYEEKDTPYNSQVLKDVKKAWNKDQDDDVLFAITSSEDVAGVLLYHLDTDTKVVEVKAYMIKDEFKGIGLFHLLFDTLCEKMKIKGIDNLILDYYEESLQIEPMFREITTKNLKKSVYLSIYSWIDSIK